MRAENVQCHSAMRAGAPCKETVLAALRRLQPCGACYHACMRVHITSCEQNPRKLTSFTCWSWQSTCLQARQRGKHPITKEGDCWCQELPTGRISSALGRAATPRLLLGRYSAGRLEPVPGLSFRIVSSPLRCLQVGRGISIRCKFRFAAPYHWTAIQQRYATAS